FSHPGRSRRRPAAARRVAASGSRTRPSRGLRGNGQPGAHRGRLRKTTPMIPITIPCLGEEEALAAAQALRSGWVSQGPKVAEFERIFAEYCGTTEAVAVSNCTTALH